MNKRNSQKPNQKPSRELDQKLDKRKSDHISLCTDQTLQIEGGETLFSSMRFLHRSLPEINTEDIDIKCDFLGHQLSAPLLISCMTGGSEEGYHLNKILAKAAQQRGLAVGTGSLRILLAKPEVTHHFRLKNLAPDVPVIGNIGAVQLPELFSDDMAGLRQFYRILQDLKVDALAIHLNPGQELFQNEGDRNFSGLLDHIERLCAWSELPIIAKETGAGMGPSETAALLNAGVAYVDVAGAGGTNWMTVEALRNSGAQARGGADSISADFSDWGIPSAVATLLAVGTAGELRPGSPAVISSGGLRTPLDFAKAIATGAALAGAALPFIRRAQDGGLDACLEYIDEVIKGIKTAMLLTASANLEHFRKTPLLFDARLQQQLDAVQATAKLVQIGRAEDHAEDHAEDSLLSSKKFRRYPIHKRRHLLSSGHGLNLDTDELAATSHSPEMLELADAMVESAVGFMPVPLGVAQNFLMDGREIQIPMATEEPSVIAAANYAAGIISRNGGFSTTAGEPLMSSHIYLKPQSPPSDPERREIMNVINKSENDIRALLRPVLQGMEDRGGGLAGIDIRWLEKTGVYRVELIIDVCDAMGANILNSAAETAVPFLEQISGTEKLMAVLSNQAERRIAGASFAIPFPALHRGNYSGKKMAGRIVMLNHIAMEDPARAVTHNKGIMNGINALAMATANDSRAVEAAAHAWAARDGSYRSLSKYKIENGLLKGSLELPLALGTVGGATNFHPAARMSLKILKGESQQTLEGKTLARIGAALGLAQNFAALSALAGEGIQKGHMKLHSSRLAFGAGARAGEIPKLAHRIQENGRYNLKEARRLLSELRGGEN